jgi:hypothetical protein
VTPTHGCIPSGASSFTTRAARADAREHKDAIALRPEVVQQRRAVGLRHASIPLCSSAACSRYKRLPALGKSPHDLDVLRNGLPHSNDNLNRRTHRSTTCGNVAEKSSDGRSPRSHGRSQENDATV